MKPEELASPTGRAVTEEDFDLLKLVAGEDEEIQNPRDVFDHKAFLATMSRVVSAMSGSEREAFWQNYRDGHKHGYKRMPQEFLAENYVKARRGEPTQTPLSQETVRRIQDVTEQELQRRTRHVHLAVGMGKRWEGHEPDQIVRAVVSVLTPDLLSPVWREKATQQKPKSPTFGHCYAAAEATYHLLGGKRAGLTPMVGRDASGGTHWWLRDKEGNIIDPTAEQYRAEGKEPPYANGKGAGFLTAKPSKRAAEVMRRVREGQHEDRIDMAVGMGQRWAGHVATATDEETTTPNLGHENTGWVDTSAHPLNRADGGMWGSSHGSSAQMSNICAAAMGLQGWPALRYEPDPRVPRAVEKWLRAIYADKVGSEEVLYHGFQNKRGIVFTVGDTMRLPLQATSGDLETSAGYGIRLDIGDQQGEPTVLRFPRGTRMVAYGKWKKADAEDFYHVYSEAIVAGAFRVARVEHLDMRHGQHDQANKDWHPTTRVKVVTLEQTGVFNPDTKQWESL